MDNWSRQAEASCRKSVGLVPSTAASVLHSPSEPGELLPRNVVLIVVIVVVVIVV